MLKAFGLFFVHLMCGLALGLALPPLSYLWAGALGLAGVAILNRDLATVSWGRRFGRGLGLGLGYFGFALHWIGYAFLVDAESYLWMMPFAVAGLALLMAIYWGLGFVAAGRLANHGFATWLAIPVALAVAEWLRGILFTGFPWAAPGLIADGMGPVLQLASVVGMPGLTLLILMWGMATAAFVNRNMMALAVLATLPLSFIWGQWRLSSAPNDNTSGPLIRLVQPNISQSDKWRSENADQIFSDLIALSTQAGAALPAVVIWPESAVPFLLDESETALSRIAAALEPQQQLLSGTLRRNVDATGEKYYTSVQLIDSDGVVQQSYDKWRLVPGGEYLPFAPVLEPLGFRKVVDLPESFTPGAGPRSFEIPGIGLGGILICYEAIFPHRLVDTHQRPRWLINVTNDGWFGNSVGPHQHVAQVRMRAVEQGLPIVRAANTGISAVIDPYGRYRSKTILGTRDVVDERLPDAIAATPFARRGVLNIWAIGFLLFGVSLLFRFRTTSAT